MHKYVSYLKLKKCFMNKLVWYIANKTGHAYRQRINFGVAANYFVVHYL